MKRILILLACVCQVAASEVVFPSNINMTSGKVFIASSMRKEWWDYCKIWIITPETSTSPVHFVGPHRGLSATTGTPTWSTDHWSWGTIDRITLTDDAAYTCAGDYTIIMVVRVYAADTTIGGLFRLGASHWVRVQNSGKVTYVCSGTTLTSATSYPVNSVFTIHITRNSSNVISLYQNGTKDANTITVSGTLDPSPSLFVSDGQDAKPVDIYCLAFFPGYCFTQTDVNNWITDGY